MKVDIPFFSENLDIESFLDWIYKVGKFFDMTSQICGVQTQQRIICMVRSIANLTKVSKRVTRDDMETPEATPIR